MCDVDARLSSDSDRVSDTATMPTVTMLTCPDSVSTASGDSHLHRPYYMMMDDSTSVDRMSCSETEGLLKGDSHCAAVVVAAV